MRIRVFVYCRYLLYFVVYIYEFSPVYKPQYVLYCCSERERGGGIFWWLDGRFNVAFMRRETGMEKFEVCSIGMLNDFDSDKDVVSLCVTKHERDEV